jgi:hypothetical protein
VQEKNITLPTDTRLRVKVMKRCRKLAGEESLCLRRSYRRELKKVLRVICFSKSQGEKKRVAAAIRRVKTMVNALPRDVMRKLPASRYGMNSEKSFSATDCSSLSRQGILHQVAGLIKPFVIIAPYTPVLFRRNNRRHPPKLRLVNDCVRIVPAIRQKIFRFNPLIRATACAQSAGPAGQDAACEVGMAWAAGVTVYALTSPLEKPGVILNGCIDLWFTKPSMLVDDCDH